MTLLSIFAACACLISLWQALSSLIWLLVRKFFGTWLGGCHGPSLDDDKAPAMGHGSSLGGRAPDTMPAATSIAKLPTVAFGKHYMSLESHSIQDLDALAAVELLWDVRGEGAETRQRERG